MMVSLSAFLQILLLIQVLEFVFPQVETCSGIRTRFPVPSEGNCLPWENQRQQTKIYPDDFAGITNQVQIYQCPSRSKRVIVSNGIPDHDLVLQNRRAPCEVRWAVEMPLYPSLANSRTEVPIRGMLAMALNGVPAYGPQENDSNNAVAGMGVPGAAFWYGHTGGNLVWHVHNPQMGRETVTSETLLGYAMDGFPIYGPLSDSEVGTLDPCNGLLDGQGNYKYHVRTLDQVDPELEYCNGNNPETNWNYILGCYSGSVAESNAFDSASYTLDDDCFVDPNPVLATESNNPPSDVPVAPSTDDIAPKGVNVIVMQPDDLVFFDEWSAPPNNPNQPNQNVNFPTNGLPNIERLRLNGLQMLQAYTASPMCGTSRYSTITGKYPSRAESNTGASPSRVTIPSTKLQGEDCTRNNLAAEFQKNGYRTAMFGKWHLSNINKAQYTYDSATEIVQQCGFSTIGALYIENLAADPNEFNSYSDGTFSHNLEWVTYEALKVIQEDTEDPFFMYFNPTVPHGANSIESALTEFSCQDTPAGSLGFDPMIPGMTEEYGSCDSYRQSIISRSNSPADYGSIWLDDSVGALLRALEVKGILDSTIFLFQIDHGMDTKSTIYEGGVRIPQFIHYPSRFSPGDTSNVPVSTIDIAATMLDFAGITPSYELDGESWQKVIGNRTEEIYWEQQRCLFFEIDRDRAVRCGCQKYLVISDNSSNTYSRGARRGFSNDPANLFDLCGGSEDYVTAKQNNQEASNLFSSSPVAAMQFSDVLQCHLSRIDLDDFGSCDLVEDEPVIDNSATPAPSQFPTMASSINFDTDLPSASVFTSAPSQTPIEPSTVGTEAPTTMPTVQALPTINPTRTIESSPPMLRPSVEPYTSSPTQMPAKLTQMPTAREPTTALSTESPSSGPPVTSQPSGADVSSSPRVRQNHFELASFGLFFLFWMI